MSINNIAESLFDSISVIVEKRLANLEYDKTIVCTITDVSEATQKNLYTVTDGSATFKAQGDGEVYQVNDTVRVVIAQNDYSSQKHIVGRYSEDEAAKPITYVSPLGSVLKITDNLLPNASGTYAITANGNVNELLVGEVEFEENYIQSTDIFDTLYLKAEFQTAFNTTDMRKGDYGLRIRLIAQNDDENNNLTYNAYNLFFSATSDMFGNPYAFKLFTAQEKKYLLSQWPENTIGLQVYLYQNNEFAYADEMSTNQQLTTYTPTILNTTTLYDIYVRNIEIGFGSEVTNANSQKLQLYTSDVETYHSDDSIVDDRTLKLLWYNKSENNEYIGFSDGIWDDDYNEETYLARIQSNERLLQARSANYLEDKITLTLSANAYDLKYYIEQIYKLLGTDLQHTIQGLKDYTWAIDWDSNNPFSNLLGADPDDSIGAYASKVKTQGTAIRTYYDSVLQWAKNNKLEKPDCIAEDTFTTFLNLINPDISTSIITKIDAAYATAEAKIFTYYPTYESVYTTYYNRWLALKNTLSTLYTTLYTLLFTSTTDAAENIIDNDEALLNGILNNSVVLDTVAYVDETTTDSFKAEWDNRYCIYWYRYDQTITTIDPFVGSGWERLENTMNVGLPEQQADTEYCVAKTNDGLSIRLRRRDEEKFMVVLFHNHEQIKSNELTFNNLDVVPEPTVMDANGALYLEHNNSASRDSYQLYDATGLLMNSAETQQKRELRARFDGETGGDEQLIDADIYWYVPLNATMLEIFDSDIKNSFNTDKVKTYATTAELEKDYDRGRLYSTFTNLVGPIKENIGSTEEPVYKYKYYYCVANSVYDSYKNNYEEYKIYTRDDFATATNLNTAYKYVVKIDENLYQVYIYNGEAWETSGEAFSKLNTELATSFYYTDTEWAALDKTTLDNEKHYLVGPLEGPYTYYKYDNEAWAATNMTIYDLTLATINIADYKPGYACYYKKIGILVDDETQEPILTDDGEQQINPADTILPYHIKNYYQPTSTQNSILCVVKKNLLTYETSQHFSFTAFGNRGTDYTLALMPNPEYPLVTKEDDLFIKATLYDYENQEMLITAPSIGDDEDENITLTFDWTGPHMDVAPVPHINESGYLVGCTIPECPEDSTILGGILRCIAEDVSVRLNADDEDTQTITLQTDIVIPYGLSQETYMEGASVVVYDSFGANPQYYKKPYTLYHKDTNLPVEWELTWEMRYYAAEGGDPLNLTSQDLSFLPRLSEDNILLPSAMYVTYEQSSDQIYPMIVASRTDENGNQEIVWAQFILVTQNTYSSAIINKWDGGLVVDEAQNTILANMIGAGRKNKDNAFDGVLMGDVGVGAKANDIHEIGLYGFHDGGQSFAFKVDGTAFLGKSGSGRIYMDGNNAYLYSETWIASDKYDELGTKITNVDATTGADLTHTLGGSFYEDEEGIKTPYRGSAGMLIDLKNGRIDAHDFKLTSNGINLNATPGADEYYLQVGTDSTGQVLYDGTDFIIQDYNTNPLLKVSATEYFLRSSDYVANSTGINIDLQTGSIDAYTFTLQSSNFILANTISLTEGSDMHTWASGKGNVVFKAGGSFAITDGGYFYATQGKIANWTIGANTILTNNNVGDETSFHMYANGNGEGAVGGRNKSSDWMLTIGQSFGVNKNGELYSNALYASKGVIGPLTLESTYLQAFYNSVTEETVLTTYEPNKKLFYRYPNQTAAGIISSATKDSDGTYILPAGRWGDPWGPWSTSKLHAYYVSNIFFNIKPGDYDYVQDFKLTNICWYRADVKIESSADSIYLAKNGQLNNVLGILLAQDTTVIEKASTLKGDVEWSGLPVGTYQIYILLTAPDESGQQIYYTVFRRHRSTSFYVTAAGFQGRFDGARKTKDEWNDCVYWLGLNKYNELVAYHV